MANKPRIAIWDLETGFNVGTFFQLATEYINYDNILSERYIICGSWKFYGEKGIYSSSVLDDPQRFNKDPTDDYHVVKQLHKMLSGVDAIVHHHGDRFDIKFFNTRAVFHGFKPLPEIIQIDTLKLAKKKFLFNSNRLDYIGKLLGLGTKIKTNNKLWLDCLQGSKGAVKEMLRYNKQDVYLLEDVFEVLRPYVPARVNYALFMEADVCPSCGSENHYKRGFAHTRTGKYQRLQCNDCGHWFQDKTNLAVKDKRAKYK